MYSQIKKRTGLLLTLILPPPVHCCFAGDVVYCGIDVLIVQDRVAAAVSYPMQRNRSKIAWPGGKLPDPSERSEFPATPRNAILTAEAAGQAAGCPFLLNKQKKQQTTFPRQLFLFCFAIRLPPLFASRGQRKTLPSKRL